MAHIFCRNLYANTVYRSVKKYCKKTALCKYYVYYTIVLLEVFCNLCIKYDLFFLFILLLMCLNCVYVWIYIWIVFIYVPKYMFTKSINENAYQFYHWLLLTSKMVFFIFGLEKPVFWICFGSYEGGMKVGWMGLTLDSELHNGRRPDWPKSCHHNIHLPWRGCLPSFASPTIRAWNLTVDCGTC